MSHINHKFAYCAGVASNCIYCNIDINQLYSAKNIDYDTDYRSVLKEIYQFESNDNYFINKYAKIKCLTEEEYIIKNIIE
jgi:hypothetical protein